MLLPGRDYKDTPGLNAKGLKTLHKTIAHFKSYKMLALGPDAAAITEAIQTIAEKASAKIWFCSPYADIPGGVDLAYLTGTNAQTLLALLQEALQHSNNNSVIAIGNIHASAQMEAAWQAIKNDPNVTVTIDTYHLGLVFFRHGQAKQHFIVRPYRSFLLDAFLGIRSLWGLRA